MTEQVPEQGRSCPAVEVVEVVSHARTGPNHVAVVVRTKDHGTLALTMAAQLAPSFVELARGAEKRAAELMTVEEQRLSVTAKVCQSFGVGQLTDNRHHVLLIVNPDSAVEERVIFPIPVARAVGGALLKEAHMLEQANKIASGRAGGLMKRSKLILPN